MRPWTAWAWAAAALLPAADRGRAAEPLRPACCAGDESFLPSRSVRPAAWGVPPLSRSLLVPQAAHDYRNPAPRGRFDPVSYFGPARGWPAAVARGAELGLVLGSASYVGGVLAARHPRAVGAAGLVVGFGLGALTDLKWPGHLTLQAVRDQPLSFGLGWLRAPDHLPGGRAQLSGSRAAARYAAGVGLHFSPRQERDLNLDLFLEPFATKGASVGGLQMSFGF